MAVPDHVDPFASLATALADRYQLDREIGRGGMGTVYLAHDLKLGRKVAIKVLPPERASAEGTNRFLREIRLMARLQHPRLVTIHDSGQAGGVFYYVMPYVEGESLRVKLVREGPLTVLETLRILHNVLEGLAYVHASGVLHRDIKPENVLLLHGQALVIDFGVAKPLSASATPLTPLATALGTPRYMPPEQLAGGPVDQRVDLYAIGVMAYEMLMGAPPFLTFWELEHRQLASITRRRPEVPVLIEAMVLRCLEKRPEDRWNRADDLLPVIESAWAEAGAAQD